MQRTHTPSHPDTVHPDDLTIPEAMARAGIKTPATFNKYLSTLNIPVKKPGIGSRRHYISPADVERVRQLREDPRRLEELRYPPPEKTARAVEREGQGAVQTPAGTGRALRGLTGYR